MAGANSEQEAIQIDALGESAFILRRLGGRDPVAIAQGLDGLPGVREATPAYETVGVYVEPGVGAQIVRERLAEIDLRPRTEPRFHEIPICYEKGEDLEEAALHLSLSMEELAQLHARHVYRCFAIGFQPGFPYLGDLPERLQGLARRPSPRPAVPAGSVGIVGRQTGIYPSETPGGWWLIGRTPLTIVELADAYFPIAAGDEVRFVPISLAEYERRQGRRL